MILLGEIDAIICGCKTTLSKKMIISTIIKRNYLGGFMKINFIINRLFAKLNIFQKYIM